MPYVEALKWFKYRRKYGGLPQQRIAHLLGTLCVMFNNANGGKAEIQDFLPEMKEAAEREELKKMEAFFGPGFIEVTDDY